MTDITILSATASDYEWVLEKPISNGLHTYSKSDISIVKIETDAGITGYGIGRPRPGERELRASFLETLVGKDPTRTEAIWSNLWSPKMSGRRGYETRALSSIDIALWDIKAKMAGLPLHRLLGGYRDSVPVYIAGGYYTEGKGFGQLQDELRSYVELGARAVKIKVGAVSIAEDVVRVRAAREAIGDDIALMLDANCAYRYYEAIQFAKRVEEFDPAWFEEPVQPDDYEGFAKIAAATTIPIATGENEYTKHGFRDLIATQAVPILNPDARYMGGVTEFMKVAAMAQAHGIDIAPHGLQQLHLPLLAAIPNGRILEFYPGKGNGMSGRIYRGEVPSINADGTVTAPNVPGAGLEPDEEAMAPYRIG
ncbi:mandelate racemase/muconate lactonizing enzyme family protein [Homoserinimonas sp. A447]